MSFHSSPFFPDPSFPSGHCMCHTDVLFPKTETLPFWWLVLSHLFYCVWNRCFGGGRGHWSKSSGYGKPQRVFWRWSWVSGSFSPVFAPSPQSLLCPWVFKHISKALLEAKSEISSFWLSTFQAHGKVAFSIHWAWVGPCDKLWPMSYKQKMSLLSFCHHGANILNSGPSIYVLKWGPNKAEPSANPKQVYCICVRNKSLLC